MFILAKMLELTAANELIDLRFRKPRINQFAKRIQSDIKAVMMELKTGTVILKDNDGEFTEEYSAKLGEIINFELENLIGRDISELKFLSDNLHLEGIEVATAAA
jgi:hypothetical protein